MRAEVINMVKVLVEVTEDIFIKVGGIIYAIREEDDKIYLRVNDKIVWCSERQSLSIEDMEMISSWYQTHLNYQPTTEAEGVLIDSILKALEHRKELRNNK